MAAPVCVVPVHDSWLWVSYDAEDHGEILLVGHLNPAVLISIVPSEHIRQPLGRREKNNRHFCSDCHRLPLTPGLLQFYEAFLFIPSVAILQSHI